MRWLIPFIGLALLCLASAAQDEGKPKKVPRRFGFDLDETTFPQRTPKDAMKSIGAALDRKRIDYMLAHMVDPKYVDYWIGEYQQGFTLGGEQGKLLLGFDRLVRETTQYLQDDPQLQRELRSFAREADWAEDDTVAIGTRKDLPTRKVFLKLVDGRWFLETKQQ